VCYCGGGTRPTSSSPEQNRSTRPVSQIGEAAASATTPTTTAPMVQGAPAAPHAVAPNSSDQSEPAPASAIPSCDKPGGMGLARIVEIDTTGGPGFGL
jgi:hypothetical protein